jgi:adenosylmethionine-8-amino-7-oxononanoate aminotransferase
MMCIAKAITNGYFPFGAVMIGGKIAEAFESNTDAFGNIGHGYTYSAHPVGCAAALACIPEIEKANVAANAAARGEELFAAAEALKAKHELVGDVRGKGLMVAIELVSDRAKKTPAGKDMVATVFETAYAEGVMVRVSGPNIILSPPLVITASNVAKIASAIDAGLTAAG